ncbi:MAG: hypothetical protein AAGA20_18040 [Planctomycetota bacterium]
MATEIDAWSRTTVNGMEICIRTEGPADAPFAIWSSLDQDGAFDPFVASPMAAGRFDALGHGELVVPMNRANTLPADFGVQLYLLTRTPGGYDSVGTWLPLSGSGGTLCQSFDPNFKIGDDEPVAGEILNTQWELVNMAITGEGGNGGPDAVIVFDSANPTGNDTDLATPGTGTGNTEALGNVLILPGDLVDADADGLVDIPCDNADGGVMRFDFGAPYRMCSATILDIDEGANSELRFYIGDAMTLETIPLADLGDNSAQTLTFDKRDVRRFELFLEGSGALARLEMIPCPLLVNLDEEPFGKPRLEQAGTIVTNQYQDIGLTISAMNDTPGNPDACVLFDSENPTGNDPDLMTPGPGINNTEPLGLVLVIAENDVDSNGDGLIDDPDDEAGGGEFLFEFDEDVTFFSARVLDVDGVERDVFTFFDAAGAAIQIIEINALGDNSVQTVAADQPIEGVRTIQVNVVGSGAVTRLRFCPSSNFDGGGGNPGA